MYRYKANSTMKDKWVGRFFFILKWGTCFKFIKECSLGEADCESKDQGIGHSHEASEFQTNVPKSNFPLNTIVNY